MERFMRSVQIPGTIGNVDSAMGGSEQPFGDTAEMVHISSLALLKMLKHGRVRCHRRRRRRLARPPHACAGPFGAATALRRR